MRDALTRVRGAISTKNLMPVLTHFAFRDGWVAGFDGRMYIQAPLPKAYKKLRCTVEAAGFIAALDACDNDPEDIKLEEDRLIISHRRFRASLPIGKVEDYVPSTPDPIIHQRRAPLLPKLKQLFPFIGEDASRPWACAIMLDGTKAYATNNSALARATLSQGLPGRDPAGLPRFAVEELLRIGEEPTAIGRTKNGITFYYSDKSWLRSVLFDTTWPAPPDSMLEGPIVCKAKIPPSLIEAVRKVQPFCVDPKNPVIVFDGSVVKTEDGIKQAEINMNDGHIRSVYALGHGHFRVEPLLVVLEAAVKADWIDYPRVRWQGDGIDGILVGVRIQ